MKIYKPCISRYHKSSLHLVKRVLNPNRRNMSCCVFCYEVASYNKTNQTFLQKEQYL